MDLGEVAQGSQERYVSRGDRFRRSRVGRYRTRGVGDRHRSTGGSRREYGPARMPEATLDPPYPVVLAATTFVLVSAAGAALLSHSWSLAVVLLGVVVLPWARSPGARQGAAVGAAGAAVGLALTRVLGMLEAPSWLLGAALVMCAVRAWVLQREAVRRWASIRRVVAVETATPLEQALSEALRAPPEERRLKLDRAVVALASAAPESAPGDPVARRALWINVYNVLAAHASQGRRSVAFDAVLEPFRLRYPVFGRRLSPNDIEHGLLRDNACPPGWPRRALRAGDPRLAWRVPLDPRIHFALNCSSRSCPPIRVYEASDLEAQLERAQASFCTTETQFDAQRGRVTTSKILRWYARDFGGHDGVRRRLAAVLGVPAIRSASIAYAPYDWTNPEGHE